MSILCPVILQEYMNHRKGIDMRSNSNSGYTPDSCVDAPDKVQS